MSETKPHSDRRYVVIWAALVLALLASLALGALGASSAVIAIIFVVAAFKAYLVAAHFMHIAHEPRYVAFVLLGALTVVAILYFGLVPDIVWAETQAGAGG